VISDPITAMQMAVRRYLANESAGAVELDGNISTTAPWRPHVFQRKERVGWHLHSMAPDSDSWEKRVLRSRAGDKKLRVGVGGTEDVMRNASFLQASHKLGARLILVKERKDGFLVEEMFASAPDFICQQRVKLDTGTARDMLDLALERALTATTKVEKGVTLELLVALMLSQVDNFEVTDIGIANRTQQMDVLVHNRGVAGVLGASPIVLAEAKNWSAKVTPTEHAAFLRKLSTRNARAKLGFLVTTGKFTAGVALEARRDSKEDTIVCCVDGATLPTIWRGKRTITEKIERLVIDASVGH
jgi:hypothetical protein